MTLWTVFFNVDESSDPLLIFEDQRFEWCKRKWRKKRINQFDDFVTMILNVDEFSFNIQRSRNNSNDAKENEKKEESINLMMK